MLTRVTSLLWICACFPLCAAHVQFDLNDFRFGGALNNRPIRITPLDAPRAVDTNMIGRDVVNVRTDNTGSVIVSNMTAGLYRADIVGQYTNTTFQFTVTNTTALVNVVGLTSLNTNAPTATQAWSASASDARYEQKANKNQNNGYAGLNASGIVPAERLGTGDRDGTKFLRDDNTWQTVAGGTPASPTFDNNIGSGGITFDNQ